MHLPLVNVKKVFFFQNCSFISFSCVYAKLTCFLFTQLWRLISTRPWPVWCSWIVGLFHVSLCSLGSSWRQNMGWESSLVLEFAWLALFWLYFLMCTLLIEQVRTCFIFSTYGIALLQFWYILSAQSVFVLNIWVIIWLFISQFFWGVFVTLETHTWLSDLLTLSSARIWKMEKKCWIYPKIVV